MAYIIAYNSQICEVLAFRIIGVKPTKQTIMYKGFLSIGASNKREAEQGQGMQIYMESKPNAIKRFFMRHLLNIYWVDTDKSDISHS